MSKLVNPASFSAYFGISAQAFVDEALLEPILNSDTRVFIDPLLLGSSGNDSIKNSAVTAIKKRFEDIVRLLSASTSQQDPAWKAALRLLDLRERRETCLGYGGASVSGSSRPMKVRIGILKNVKDIISVGENDPYIISLMGLFDDNVGPDTISDFVTNIIFESLSKMTSEFCDRYSVNKQEFKHGGATYRLPANPFNEAPILLVPQDIVRDLPFAVDWDDVSRVIMEIQEIRDAVNQYLSGMTHTAVVERKEATKKAMLASLATFRSAFEVILNSSNKYDPNLDALNIMAFREIISKDLSPYRGLIAAPKEKSAEELLRIVKDIIGHFRKQVESNNLWELLWIKDKPKLERAAQTLFFAIADVFCKANDVDISPETHSGGGPVDFKFSSGYSNRVLVEVKRSIGSVVSGYKRQLEIYKSAAQTDAAFYLIIDVGKIGNKLTEILAWREVQESTGKKTSQIEVVDAKRRISASKA